MADRGGGCLVAGMAGMAGAPPPPPWAMPGGADASAPPPPPPPSRMPGPRHEHPPRWLPGEALRCMSCGAGYAVPVLEGPEGGGGGGGGPYAA